MNSKIEQINSPSPGFVESLRDFLKLLEDMERKNEKMRNVSGETKGPFDSKAEYSYTVKIGIEKNDTISVVAYLPHIREDDIELDITDNRFLRITAKTPDGNLVRNIRVSDEKSIESIKEASFKKGILTTKLRRKLNEVR
ncbi:MAG: Hsp20/alpha crystallin family protein [Candidatus Methanoperedens sp.]|nr:Hsp20/alpha crystallin family protein [Candidatus Methanoperedens sp.]